MYKFKNKLAFFEDSKDLFIIANIAENAYLFLKQIFATLATLSCNNAVAAKFKVAQ